MERQAKAKKLAEVCKVLGNEKASEILIVLEEPLTLGQVAERVGLSLSRTSRLASELERIGLIEHTYETRIGEKGIYKTLRRKVKTLTIEL